MRVRDHLANVRTFLATVRVGLALSTLSYVVVKFGVVVGAPRARPASASPAPLDRVVGMTLGVLGVAIGVAALIRFLVARRLIESATTEVHMTGALLLVAATAVAGAMLLGYVVTLGV